MLAAVEDEVAFIVLPVGGGRGSAVAEDATGSAVGRGDVSVAPGSEDVIHTGESNKPTAACEAKDCGFSRRAMEVDGAAERGEVGENSAG